MPAAERSLPLYVVDAFTDRRFRGNPDVLAAAHELGLAKP